MAATFIGGAPVSLNGTTPVTVVAAPGVGHTRQVMALHCSNLGTSTRTMTVKKVTSGTPAAPYATVTLQAGARGQLLLGPITLGVNDSVTVEMDLPVATTNPIVDAAVFES